MAQFFIKPENIDDNEIFITDSSDINHIINVLRFTKGDEIMLAAPDDIVYNTQIIEIRQNLINTKIIDKYKSNRKLNINITLAQSILKGQKQDIVIQKVVELGVNSIIPFISKNAVVKINSEKEKIQKNKRWQKIAYEAAKQCQRTSIPEISQIVSINELLNLNDFDIKFVCVEKNSKLSIKTFLTANKAKHKNILVAIGPEGGWDGGEFKLFKENDFSCVTLGNLILRAETAAITAIANIIYEYEL